MRKIPLTVKEYGSTNYIGETETHYLVTQVDREGNIGVQVFALNKEEWELKNDRESKNN